MIRMSQREKTTPVRLSDNVLDVLDWALDLGEEHLDEYDGQDLRNLERDLKAARAQLHGAEVKP